MIEPRASQPTQRGRLQRGIVILPNAFTLGNLFFGFWAVVSALRGQFELAAWLIFLAAIADALDGRVARFARTGSAFGTELDSLVDLISFGVAPGVMVYLLFFEAGEWSWTLSFIYVCAVALRLARFNIEQGGRAKRHFHGLPSPVAGATLAAFYPFSQTAFFDRIVGAWPWETIIGGGMIVIAGLMLSHALYPAVPSVSLRSNRGRVALAVMLVAAALIIWAPRHAVFPMGLAYISYGALKAVTLGLLERMPDRDLLSDEFDAEETETRDLEYEEMTPRWKRE